MCQTIKMHIEPDLIKAQRDELKKLGCDAFQGYLYSKPIKLDELMSWIKGSGHES